MISNLGGRPPVDLDNIVQKLEPYLKVGLSMRKACIQAKIPRSTVYDNLRNNQWFSDQIARFKQYLSVLVSSAIFKYLNDIVKTQSEGKKLSKDDISFLQWFAVNSNSTKEEFGGRDIVFSDPEEDIQRIAKIFDEASDNNNVLN